MAVAIQGSGMAANSCAYLLKGKGFRVSIEAASRPPLPSMMVSNAALALMRDLFGRPDLMADAPRVRRRLVAWGGEPVMIPHDAVLASESTFQRALAVQADDAPLGMPDFTLHAAPLLPAGELHMFGERHALVARVRLLDPACREESRIEAVEAGWLFLVPAEGDEGWLLAVGGEIDALLAQSRLIAPFVDAIEGTSHAFPAAPRLHLPLVGGDWLACGTAAMGFDPICGDGAAHSVRQAILASAVVHAIAQGEDRQALLGHYQAMLIATMRRHLLLSAQFYSNGGQGHWWRAQQDALMQGHGWCTGLLAKLPEPQFELHGLRLVRRRAAA
jgi:flavin-dependent dehydrogenase